MSLLVLVLSLTVAGPGVMRNARADPLTNVRAVKLNVAKIGPMGQDCGLTKDAIETAFFEPLRERGIQTVQSATAYRIFVRATTITYLQESCVSYVDAQLLVTTHYADPANNLERAGNVQLWTQGGIHASGRSEHAATVNSAIRGLAMTLGSAWDAAN
jgi:hypothetical protein